MNTEHLRVLLIEDSPVTTELCLEAFKSAGRSVCMDVCRDKGEFEQRIAGTNYDVIVSAYDLTNWKPIETMEIVRRMGKRIPTIVVAGPLGEEFAVECVREGAADYVLKEGLGRLPFAVRRAIDENVVRWRTQLLAEALVNQREAIVIAEVSADLANSKIVAVNAAFTRMTGHTADDLIGKPLSCLQAVEAGKDVLANREGRLPNLDCATTEIGQPHSGGFSYDGKQTLPIHDSSGQVSHHVVIYRDGSVDQPKAAELARSNEELIRHAEELKEVARRAETESRANSDLVVSLSHEIRTPMTVIVGMAEVLSGSPLTTEQAKYVEIIQRAGEDLLVMVNHLLDLSKIESGKFDLERIEFDLNAVLTQITALFDIPARAKGLSLSFRVVAGTPTRLIGDPYQLKQVLTNLIGNAIKFTEKGSITVEARLGEILHSPDCSLQFTVTDTGVGIPDDKKDVIFEHFAQAECSFPRLYGGTGLGLAICRALIEKMKGTIMVESRLGLGSKFHFTAQFGMQSGCPAAVLEPKPLRILLCEDSQDNALLVSTHLRATRYEIVHVPDGKAGVERFKNEIFDAVLMDTQLPVLDGWEATRRIRQWEANLGRNPTPIVALTTHAQEEQFATGEASGFTGFLRKPLRKTTLLAALAKQIPQKNADHNDCVLPEEVQRLVPNYLEQKRGDLLRLWSAIKAADYATISTVGHQLKASGTSFGFIEFSEIGSAIERAGKSQDLGESRTQAELLEDSLSLLFAATSNTL